MRRNPHVGPIDWGRLVAVPLFCLAIFANALRVRQLWPHDLLAIVTTSLVLVFYGLLIIQYLRRGPATSADRRPIVWVVALAGMLAPFAVLPVSPGQASTQVGAIGSVLITAGIGGAIWSLWHLGRNISVIPQVRSIASTGPYGALRHPLYFFEIIATAGLVLVNGGGQGWAVLGVAAICLFARAKWEERLLVRELPAYKEYLARHRGRDWR